MNGVGGRLLVVHSRGRVRSRFVALVALWRYAGVAWLAVAGARRSKPLELVPARSSWWWLAGISSFGDGGINKRGGGSESDPCRSVHFDGHGGLSDAGSNGSGVLRWPEFGVVWSFLLGLL